MRREHSEALQINSRFFVEPTKSLSCFEARTNSGHDIPVTFTSSIITCPHPHQIGMNSTEQGSLRGYILIFMRSSASICLEAYLTLITIAYASFGFVAQSKFYAFGVIFAGLSIVFSIIFYLFDVPLGG